MSAEIKSGKFSVANTFDSAPGLRAAFARHCRKLKISAAQRHRDLMQHDIKTVIVIPEKPTRKRKKK